MSVEVFVALLFLLGLVIASIMYLLLTNKSYKGCNGNCNQGRLPCDCRGKE
jgi:hypothetical protein